ncbi:integration host factor alpha subunit [Endozoicomonas sp. NE40]|uniref:Integration host factor subunit alpha n=2 Tax=Endozoicomonas lisbonensis TaxID=3120522 RepID=A0ABV2SKV3_9GAMM
MEPSASIARLVTRMGVKDSRHPVYVYINSVCKKEQGCVLLAIQRVEVTMGALTKADIAEHLHEELGFNKREAKEMVEQFFEQIRQALENNEQVKLSGFGNFDLRDKKARPGRNPKTGQEIPITPRRVVTFRPGQKLKARVEAYAGHRVQDS